MALLISHYFFYDLFVDAEHNHICFFLRKIRLKIWFINF